MPYKLSNSFFYGPGYSTFGPTNSAASPKCLYKWYQIPSLTTTATLLTVPLTLLLPLNALQMTQFLLLLPLLLYLRPYQLCCFPWMPDTRYISFAYGQYYSTCDPIKLFYCCLLYSVKLQTCAVWINMSRFSIVYARPATFLLCFNICTSYKNNIDIQTHLSLVLI